MLLSNICRCRPSVINHCQQLKRGHWIHTSMAKYEDRPESALYHHTHFFCYHFEAWTKYMVVILKTATANTFCEMASLIFCFKLPWKLFLGVKLVWNWLGAVYATNNTLNKWHIQCKSVTLDIDGSYNAQGLPIKLDLRPKSYVGRIF